MGRKSLKRSLNDYKKQKEAKEAEIEARKKGFTMFKIPKDVDLLRLPKPSEGPDMVKLVLDFLIYEQTKAPFENDNKAYHGREYFYHRNMGADGRQSVLCPKTFGDKCPICEQLHPFYEKGIKELSKAEEAEYRRIKSKKNMVYNVIHEGEVKLFDMSYYCFEAELQKKLEAKALMREDVLCFAEDDNGYTVHCVFSKEKLGKIEFYKLSDIELVKREPIPEEVFGMIIPLDDLFPDVKTKDLEKYVSDDVMDDDDDYEDDEEEDTSFNQVSSRRSAYKTNEAPWDEDEEEDEEEDDKLPDYESPSKEVEEEDDEEEEAKPRRRKRKVSY